MTVEFHLEMVLDLEPFIIIIVKGPLPHTQHSSPTCAHCIPGDIISRKMGKGSQ